MWEIPFYLIAAPVIVLSITFFFSRYYGSLLMGPLLVFMTLNLFTILLPLIYNVGWEALLGWALFYTAVSFLFSLFLRRRFDTYRK